MFGLIGKMRAQPGKRAELVAALSEGTGQMPGCLHYIIMEDAAEPDAIWITEVWDSESSHKASLQLPAVQAAIARGRPLIAGFDLSAKGIPVAGAYRRLRRSCRTKPVATGMLHRRCDKTRMALSRN
jgi:quinol monooxygenase YgiN